jgi:signal transduction histidine kinase
MRISQSQRALCLSLILSVLVVVPRGTMASDLGRLYLLEPLFQIMAAEGLASAGEDAAVPIDPMEQLLWRAELARIYDAPRMQAQFETTIAERLANRSDVEQDALDFARSELGARVLQLEVTAREALLDDTVDEMARLALSEARDARPDSSLGQRLALVRERIAVNDLIELNVSLGLNTTLAYYQGMLAEAPDPSFAPDDVLALVWSQEEDIRADIKDWIESYFLLAYQPLSDDDMRAYIDYCASPLGDAFNRVLFAGFDAVFVGISGDVGRALGRMLGAESL